MDTTALGTPASPKWDPDWLAEVERVETELGHRICGAHTPAWTPCKLSSTHPNGRCRFHGGAPGIGAPGGNRNAWVHGLYSRRLQQCGEHCPLWKHCPMAGRDVLDLPAPERPHCVYEQDEYEEILTSLRATTDASLTPASPFSTSVGFHGSTSTLSTSSTPSTQSTKTTPAEPAGLIQRNVALFQVMLSRAQAALRVARLTDDTSATAENYQMHSTRVSALVQAQLHIARELRAWLKLLPGFDVKSPTQSSTPPPEKSFLERAEEILQGTEGVLEQILGVGPGETSPFGPLPRPAPSNA